VIHFGVIIYERESQSWEDGYVIHFGVIYYLIIYSRGDLACLHVISPLLGGEDDHHPSPPWGDRV